MSSLRASNSSSMGPAAARWRASEASAQCAAFCPLMNIAPKVGPMRGQPSSSATCEHVTLEPKISAVLKFQLSSNSDL